MANPDFIVVTGTRNQSLPLTWAMDNLWSDLGGDGFRGLVIHGGVTTGADLEALRCWKRNCWASPAPWEPFKRTLGNSKIAGPVRNAALAGAANALLSMGYHGKCFAFPDAQSRGTWDCVNRMKAIGLEVEVREIGNG